MRQLFPRPDSCGIAVLVGVALAAAAVRRTAAVGRVEYTILFLMYALVQGAQLADNSGLLRQGSLAISWSALPLRSTANLVSLTSHGTTG